MNFKDAKFVQHLIWYDGPLLSVYERHGRTYLVKWVDIDDDRVFSTWLVLEVAPEILDLYLGKALTLREVEERAPAVFVQEGFIDDSDAAWTDIDDVPEDWKARSNSYYDESMNYEKP